jgi:hypothetical protein
MRGRNMKGELWFAILLFAALVVAGAVMIVLGA